MRTGSTFLLSLVPGQNRLPSVFREIWLIAALFALPVAADADAKTVVRSPDGRNLIVLHTETKDVGFPRFEVKRDGRTIIRPSVIEPVLAGGGTLGKLSRIVAVNHGKINDRFMTPWGKTNTVVDQCYYAVFTLATHSELMWEVELRAYDDGVAFRYRVPKQPGLDEFRLRDEFTQFDVAGNPSVLFNTLRNFTTSHESLYRHEPLSAIPAGTLLEMPVLLHWPGRTAAAITEARVRNFAGAYLERPAAESTTLRCRLAPSASHANVCVVSDLPHQSPWRVVLLADVAGKLLESNLLLCLNDPQLGDFDWLRPGKTTWHWWNGAFEDDYQLPRESRVSFNRHRKYIDFCAENKIAYHAVSGDGFAWYQQSKTGYGKAAADADVLTPRAEIELPKILEYARERGVGIRLWVHWKPLSRHLDEAFALYQSWGVQGLMVDFLNRDDQEMVEFIDRILLSAARHQLHIQLHGCAKYSGEQRTFPHLFNREGVLNLEFLKWSDLCTPAHNVDVAYTRALAGPVDYHLGGFRSVSRAEFKARDRAPNVMGTRCHHLALYVVYENPMPMVADAPDAYEGQVGFDFISEVPTTWDETKFLSGTPGEYVVVARRKRDKWYVGGIANWTPRELELGMDFLGPGTRDATLYVDGSMDEAAPNKIRVRRSRVNSQTRLSVSLASGGGFVLVLGPGS